MAERTASVAADVNHVVVRGMVADFVAGGASEVARACLARGHLGVAAVEADRDGRFRLVAAGCRSGSYHLLVLADGREAVRRRLDVAGDVDLDVGSVTLVPVEWPSGVNGRLWDETAQAPVGPATVTMTTESGESVARVRAELDGVFAVTMSCHRPLPPGRYVLDVDAVGYAPGRLRLDVVEERTSMQLGRIHLDPRPT